MKRNHPAPPLDQVILKASGRYGPEQLFEAMVDLTLAELGCKAATAPGGDLADAAQPLKHGLIEAISARPPFSDVLGDAYMALRSNGKAKQFGQWFTPDPVAAFMSQILMADMPADRHDDGGLRRMCDPACGSGMQMLKAAQTLSALHGDGALLNWSFSGIDLDNTCAKIAALGFLLALSIHGKQVGELVVYRGDALASPESWRTIVHATAGCASGPNQPVVPALHPVRTEAIQAAAASNATQLTLF